MKNKNSGKRIIANLFIVIGSALMALFLLLAPRHLDQALSGNRYLDWLRGAKVEWTGQLTVWNVYTEAEGVASATLASAIKSFERKNPGVYCAVVRLSANQAAARLNSKILPDVIVCPRSAGLVTDIEDSFSVKIKPQAAAREAGFEFDINAPESTPPPDQFIVYDVGVMSQQTDFAARAQSFAVFLAAYAGDVVE